MLSALACAAGWEEAMKRVMIAATCTVIVALAVVASQRSGPQEENGVAIEPRTAIGAVHPRISPDGSVIAFSYQGAIWTVPRGGGTMTRLTDGPGLSDEGDTRRADALRDWLRARPRLARGP